MRRWALSYHLRMLQDPATFYSARKSLSGNPGWVKDGNNYQLVVALDDENGSTIEGARLRLKALEGLRESAVTIQLELDQADRNDTAVCRIDWRPLHNHSNQNRGPTRELRCLLIEGSHIHAFEHNWLPDENRLLSSNLPIAAPLDPEPSGYQDLLKVASGSLNVLNLSVETAPPPWGEIELDLFNGSV